MYKTKRLWKKSQESVTNLSQEEKDKINDMKEKNIKNWKIY